MRGCSISTPKNLPHKPRSSTSDSQVPPRQMENGTHTLTHLNGFDHL